MKTRPDILIIGGGSAGCVLAARLSADPATRVLLLEAGGGDHHPLNTVPAGFARMTRGIHSWGWRTVPQRHLNGRVLRFTQAKVIGGGSTINAQIYTRGHPADYDNWHCDGWRFDDLLPYFRRAENNDTFDDEHHARGGPLSVSKPAAPLPVCEAYFEAAAELGIPRNFDLAGATRDGVGYYQLTQRHARRCSAATAYLRPALRRRNLTVRKNAQVLRLLIDGDGDGGGGLVARGVELAGGERIHAAQVILSCGAIGSPRLLQLSGIGPAAHLESLGIQVVLDRPAVGANLQDHLDLFTICECTGEHSYDKYARPHWSLIAGLRYLFTRRGPAASSLFETGGFWYADSNAGDAAHPDIQLHLGLGSGIEAGVMHMNNAGVTLNSAYLRPRSRGSVRLASADPRRPPLIDPNYWAESHDRAMSIRGLKLAQDIMRQPALKPFIGRECLPGPAVKTDADYAHFAGQHAKTDHHPVGTCRMGNDAEAVVDPRLRFNGIDNLRIADASVMPNLISANTNATVITLAEKSADLLREDA